MKLFIIPGLTTKWKYPRPPPRVASKINTAMKMILRFTFTGQGGSRRVCEIRHAGDHRKIKKTCSAARCCVVQRPASRKPRTLKDCLMEI
jgi:hypothetical protein